MPKNITEIFKSNPDLLETPEVKELIEQFSTQFKSLQNEKHKYWDFVTDILLHTDFYVIDGMTPKEAVSKLIKKSFL